MVLLDRRPRKDDRWLTFKVWSFSVGSVLAVAGMAMEIAWMIWLAIAVLAVGFAARFFRQGGEEQEGEGPADRTADEGPSDATPAETGGASEAS